MAYSGMLKNEDTELIQKLQSENTLLLEENRKLNDTISWMHDTIWHLIRTRHTDRYPPYAGFQPAFSYSRKGLVTLKCESE
jgi:hypothetical protein